MAAPPSVETLAHVFAPSGARDDAKYRAQAAACVSFQPVARLRIDSSGLDDADPSVGSAFHDDGDQSRIKPSTENDGDDGGDTTLGAQFLDGTPLDDSQRTTSSFSERDHAVVEDACVPPPPSSALPSSPRIEISLISSSEEQSLDHPPTVTVAHHDPSHRLGDSVPLETPPNTVPDSQPVLTPSLDIERDHSPDVGPIEVPHQWADQPPSEKLQPPYKKPRVSTDENPRENPRAQPPPLASSSPVLCPELQLVPDGPDSAQLLHHTTILSHLPLEIHPPPPVPSSTAEFTTHITATLQMLSERMKLARVFRPSHQTRPLRTLERGHWFLRLPIAAASDTTRESKPEQQPVWPIEFFSRFWSYLSRFIGQEARAGWGVWCVCEPGDGLEVHHTNLKAHENGSASNSGKSLLVKVYTWGEIAPHIYLLLYLASERRIKSVREVEWRDGKEEAVIRMH